MEAVQWAVKHRVSRCKEDFENEYKNLKKRKAAIEESKNQNWNDCQWDGRDRCECPACLSSGFLGGTLWKEEVIDTESGWMKKDEYGNMYGDLPSETVEKTFVVEMFECPVCAMRLYGIQEIVAAELPDEFTETEERERKFEDEYGND